MNRFSVGVAVSAFAILLFASGAWAVNMTIADTMGDGASPPANSWYRGVNVADTFPPRAPVNENNEVEPGMATGQAWDFEAVLFNGSTRTLTMIAGWDFRGGYQGWASGDVFLSTNLPKYGATIGAVPVGQQIIKETFKYESVLDIDWETMNANNSNTANFTVWGLTQDTSLEMAVYGGNGLNVGSNPYRWSSIGSDLGSGTAEYQQYLNDAALVTKFGTDVAGITGGTHYSMTFRLAQNGWNEWIREGNLWTHLTMECGNDAVMGYTYVPVPEPMSMVMLGCLGAGMLGARKARQLRKAAK